MSENFAMRLPLDRVRDGDRIDMVATDDQRAAIAERLGLVSLDRLEAHAAIQCEGDTVAATGRLKAALCQSCVATGEPVQAHVDEAFDLRFVPAPAAKPDQEVELGAGELDVVFHDGAGIELGDAIADTLGLAINPYPRSANAEAALKEAGVIGEEEAGPFAALAALKDKMAKE